MLKLESEIHLHLNIKIGQKTNEFTLTKTALNTDILKLKFQYYSMFLP